MLLLSRITGFRSPKLSLSTQRLFAVGAKAAVASVEAEIASVSIFDQMATVVLEKGKAKLFQDGNPIIYGGAVREVKGDPKAGSEVLVTDHMGNLLGRGLFNPHSTYRVRMLSRGYEEVHSLPLVELLKARIAQAIALRQSIGLPNSKTNTAYRLINGEGDRLGGLIVDVFDGVIVAQSSAYWVEEHKETLEVALLEAIVGGKKSTKKASKTTVVWRRAESRLKQDGWIGSVNDDPLPAGLTGVSAAGNLLVKENGLQFSVSLSEGQKTGFYCDQRDNRLSLRAVAQGKDVLDAYCYTGGFAINAAIGGASRVVAVDSSQPALDAAAENARLNGLVVAGDDEGRESKHAVLELVKGDCVEVMKRLAEKGEKFDVVICDPPKLAPSRRDLAKARPKYLKINSLAMSLVRPGGLLLTCTCSAAMTQAGKDTDNGTKEGGGRESGRSGDGGREGWRKSGGNGGGGGGGFLGMLSEAAKLARREVTLLSSSGAAADHPVSLSYQEGAYLTAALLHVH